MFHDGWPAVAVLSVAAVVYGLLEHLVVAAAVITAAGAAILLALALVWGRRLWNAYHDLNDRVGALEVIVGREEE